ncbi:MAG: copper homeostasis protein CutC [Gemmataceae bacterium]|nr:copper homeostasis protein CutC [Gemmataceae bacterium]
MSNRVSLEVCVASVEDAVAAEGGGADRIELNCALDLGGLTPSLGLFTEVRRSVSLPIIAMVRPRQGGFCYSSTEFDVMRRDAEMLLAAGADGLAFGILTAAGEIDVERNQRLRELCSEREAVFHRAFDLTRDPYEAMGTLLAMNFKRLMTSGQEESAFEGIPLIAELIGMADKRIEILPAAGINATNVKELVLRTGCEQVHASSSIRWNDPSVPIDRNARFHSNEPVPETVFRKTDSEAVARLCLMLNS